MYTYIHTSPMSQQKLREQTISKITSILLDDNLKNNSKNVPKIKETIATFNDIDFQKLLENQLNILLDKKSITPSLDIIKLKKLKGLKYQDVPAIDLKNVAKTTQKRVESLAIKNLVQNRGGAPQKISVKTVLGKVYQKAVALSSSLIVKIQTYQKEIIIVAGICIAIYAIVSLLRLKPFTRPLLVDKIIEKVPEALSNEEFKTYVEKTIELLSEALEQYLIVTGGKIAGSNNSLFANAQPLDPFNHPGQFDQPQQPYQQDRHRRPERPHQAQQQDRYRQPEQPQQQNPFRDPQYKQNNLVALPTLEEVSYKLSLLGKLSSMFCGNPTMKQIFKTLSSGRYGLNNDCTIINLLAQSYQTIRDEVTKNNYTMTQEIVYTISYLEHRTLCAFATTDVEFARLYCPKHFPDIIQPSKRKPLCLIKTLSDFLFYAVFPMVTGVFTTQWIQNMRRRMNQPQNIF